MSAEEASSSENDSSDEEHGFEPSLADYDFIETYPLSDEEEEGPNPLRPGFARAPPRGPLERRARARPGIPTDLFYPLNVPDTGDDEAPSDVVPESERGGRPHARGSDIQYALFNIRSWYRIASPFNDGPFPVR